MLRKTSCLFFVLLFWCSLTSVAQFTLIQSLTDDSRGALSLGGTAYLTGGGEDNMGDGWLRLTRARDNQIGYAVINRSFPSSLGIEVEFEFAVWAGNGADGFSIFLFDAQYDPDLPSGDPYKFRIGGNGGSLGYANDGNTAGLAGGYLGFGIDEWGNYALDVDGKTGGAGLGRIPSIIGVRGPATSPLGAYRWLGGNTALANTIYPGFTLDYKPSTAQRPVSGIYYRRVQLIIAPILVGGVTKYEITARLQPDMTTSFVDVMTSLVIDDVPPDFLKVGFAATTGSRFHIHEVRNLVVTTPGGVRITKSVDRTSAAIQDELTYTIRLINQSPVVASALAFTDDMPAAFDVTSIEFLDGGDPGNKVVSGWSPGDLSFQNTMVDLAPRGEATFVVKGRIIDVPEDRILSNAARLEVTVQTGLSDPDVSNNEATVITTILVPEIKIEDDLITTRYSDDTHVGNVLDNDSIDSREVDLNLFQLGITSHAEAIDGGGIPYMDTDNGDIVVPYGTNIGTYRIEYQLCELINPKNCATGTVLIQVDKNDVIASEDRFPAVREAVGGVTISVLDNDLFNDKILDPALVTFTWLDSAPVGFDLQQDGHIAVDATAEAGVYELHYEICELINPLNCSSAIVGFNVRSALEARDDYFVVEIDRSSILTKSVFENDISDELPVTITDVFLASTAAVHPNFTINGDGTVLIAEGTKAGVYSFAYRVCEVALPSRCQDAQVHIELVAKELFVPNIVTPNGDGKNDLFVIIGLENFQQIELVVFNNWGIEVFRQNDYKNDWNPIYLNDDVYYYLLHLKREGYAIVRRGYFVKKSK